MSFDWDNQPVSEYELLNDDLEEFDEEAEYEYEDDYEEVAEELLESVNNTAAFELNNREASTVYNARLRLEQARLYELLINHNVFEGVEASPEAVAKVQADLKKYLVDRLEVLLGIKKKKKKEREIDELVVVDSQFNDVEVDFLKALAYKGTQGASSNGKPMQTSQVPKINTIKTVAPKPIQKAKPKLNTIKKQAPKPVQKTVIKAEEPLKPSKKVAKKKTKKKATRKKKKKSLTFQTGVKARNLTKAEIKAIAVAEIKEERALMDGRDAHELSDEEKMELMRKRSDKHYLPRPANALPPPTEVEEHTYATQHTNNVTGVGKLGDMIAASIAAPVKGDE